MDINGIETGGLSFTGLTEAIIEASAEANDTVIVAGIAIHPHPYGDWANAARAASIISGESLDDMEGGW